jgi:hypothetical protein
MQHGDLATYTRHRLVVVLEGVLATITPVTEQHRWRADKVTGWNITWHETPLKRMAYVSSHYPDLGVEVITFINQDVADLAAEFFLQANIPYESVEFQEFRHFTSSLPYQTGITQIIDSAPDRLDRYGQLGRAVLLGGDI